MHVYSPSRPYHPMSNADFLVMLLSYLLLVAMLICSHALEKWVSLLVGYLILPRQLLNRALRSLARGQALVAVIRALFSLEATLDAALGLDLVLLRDILVILAHVGRPLRLVG